MFRKFEVDNAIEYINLAEVKGIRTYGNTVAARMDGGYVKLYEGKNAKKFAASLVKEIGTVNGGKLAAVSKCGLYVNPCAAQKVYIDEGDDDDFAVCIEIGGQVFSAGSYADPRNALQKLKDLKKQLDL